MNVKEAVKKAEEHMGEVFYEARLVNLGLEEVEWDIHGEAWKVTFGFSRPWDLEEFANPINALMPKKTMRREYKVVTVSNDDGSIVSIKMRDAT